MSGIKDSRLWPVIGSVAVLVLSPVLEVATGSELAYIIVLPILIIILWLLTGLSMREVGVRWGTPGSYGVSLVYPFVVMGMALLVVWMSGNIRLENFSWNEAGKDFLLMFAATVIGVIITEEGFFRGWLWGSLERLKHGPWIILVWTSVVFALWHIPVALIEQDFKLPAAVIPVYITNVFLVGMCWGILRKVSGSVLVPSVSHGLWNAFAYVLFGYGTKAGVLGVSAYNVYGPERGLVGIVLNVVSVVLLWRWWKRHDAG